MTKILVSPDLLHRLGNDFQQASQRFQEMDYRLFQSLEPVMAEVEVRRKMYIMDQWRMSSAELTTLSQICEGFCTKLHQKAEEFAQADSENNQSLLQRIAESSEEALNEIRDDLLQTTNSILSAATGIADAVHENVTYGTYTGTAPTGYENSYLTGKLIGNAGSALGGYVETLAGGGLFTGGVALDATGVGAIGGVAANALGAAMVAQGVSVAAMGAASFGKDAKNLYSNIMGGEGDSPPTKASGEIAQRSKEVIQDISSLKNTENFRSSALVHILEGEVNSRGKAVGYHYEGMPNPKGQVVPGTETTPKTHGVYEAKVEVNGVPKSGNNGISSFFPKKMSAQELVDSINEAYANKVHVAGNTYTGTASNGMTIDLYIDSNGKIISAFPKY